MTASTVETVTSADGTDIGFERTGDGPPLVLLHGTAASPHQVTVLANRGEPRTTVNVA